MTLLDYLTVTSGKIANNKLSKFLIPLFEIIYAIKTELFEIPKDGYKDLNQWFRRDLKEGLKIPDVGLFSPCEAKLRVYPDIKATTLLRAKGDTYSLDGLVDEKLSDRYDGGTMLIFRLEPGHYHNFHHIDGGKLISQKQLSGSYFPVNNIAKLFTGKMYQNRRDITLIESINYGKIIYCEIGALNVGSILQYDSGGDFVKRGNKKGCFQFGGSTEILIFQKNRIRIKNEYSDGREHYVFFGDIIGK